MNQYNHIRQTLRTVKGLIANQAVGPWPALKGVDGLCLIISTKPKSFYAEFVSRVFMLRFTPIRLVADRK